VRVRSKNLISEKGCRRSCLHEKKGVPVFAVPRFMMDPLPESLNDLMETHREKSKYTTFSWASQGLA
jgi:hypothetical protein